MPPTAAEGLSINASKDEVRDAISSCISQMVGEGMAQDQAVAACHSMARKSTGEPLRARENAEGE